MLKFVAADADTIQRKRQHCSRACEHCRKRKKRCVHVNDLEKRDSGRKRTKKSRLSTEPNSSKGALNATILSADLEDSNPELQKHDTSQSQFDGVINDSCISNNSVSENIAIEADLSETSQVEGNLDDSNEVRDAEILGSRYIGDMSPEGILLAAKSPISSKTVNQHESIGIWLADKLAKTSNAGAKRLAEETGQNSFHGFSPIIQEVLLPLLIDESLSVVPPVVSFEALKAIYFEKFHPIFPVVDITTFDGLDDAKPATILLKQGISLVASMDFTARDHLHLNDLSSSVLNHREFGRRIWTAMKTSIDAGLVKEKIVLIQALALLSLFVEGPEGANNSSQLCGRAVQYSYIIGLQCQTEQHNQDNRYGETLLCCIWALDRLNAAFNGAPVLMHERDIVKDLKSCVQRQEPCFRLFLNTIMLLDTTINLYRPAKSQSQCEWEGDFPSFQQLLSSCSGGQISTPLLATVEIMYHAVAILSCRSRPFEDPQSSSMFYVRQSHSAAQLTSIMTDESLNQLTFFPFVPYAVSLSLSLAYIEMRHSNILMYRIRARRKMQTACEILKDMRDKSWSASMMADLGFSTLHEFDRVYSTLGNPPQQGKEIRNSIAPVSNDLTNESNPELSHQQAELDVIDRTRNDNMQSYWDPSVVSLPGNDTEMDLFDLFDPSFDLGEIDALLSGNLDLSMQNT